MLAGAAGNSADVADEAVGYGERDPESAVDASEPAADSRDRKLALWNWRRHNSEMHWNASKELEISL